MRSFSATRSFHITTRALRFFRIWVKEIHHYQSNDHYSRNGISAELKRGSSLHLLGASKNERGSLGEDLERSEITLDVNPILAGFSFLLVSLDKSPSVAFFWYGSHSDLALNFWSLRSYLPRLR